MVAVDLDYRDATSQAEIERLKIKVQHASWNHEIPMFVHRICYFQRNEVKVEVDVDVDVDIDVNIDFDMRCCPTIFKRQVGAAY